MLFAFSIVRKNWILTLQNNPDQVIIVIEIP